MNTKVEEFTEAEKLAKLMEWSKAKEAALECKPIIEAEQALRKEVVAMFFPDPKEGPTNLPLQQGWKLKAVVKLNRKIDEAALPAVGEQLRAVGVNPDTL